ncbi:MAG: SRPBCC domain-containing protein [Candidatus Thorarchaeota archaeon]|nr:MAG: SRPBCC domain-containing protein [Candidatus Thorarchaeota archaeon]
MSMEAGEDVLPLIRMRVGFRKPVEEVWDSFLDSLIMLQWLGNEISGDFKPGGSVRFTGNNAPTTSEIGDHWDIEQVRKHRAILGSWRILGAETLFILRFRPTETGSALELKHGAVPESAKSFHLASHWNTLLGNFKSVIELRSPGVRFDYSKYRPLTLTRYDPKEVRVSVLLNVPPSLPFDVFTNPEKLSRFVRAETPVVDKQYAGLYTWWAEGKGPVVITSLEQERELEFSWVYGDERETRVNIRFEPVKDSTLVTLHHHGFNSPEDVIGYDIGWTSILTELKLICELGDSGIVRLSDWEEEDDSDFI